MKRILGLLTFTILGGVGGCLCNNMYYAQTNKDKFNNMTMNQLHAHEMQVTSGQQISLVVGAILFLIIGVIYLKIKNKTPSNRK